MGTVAAAVGNATHKTPVSKVSPKPKKKQAVQIPEWLSALPEYPVEDTVSTENIKGFGTVTSLQTMDRLVIQLPAEGFNQTSLDNLLLLIASKSNLIKKSIGADELLVNRIGATICFPWFSANTTGEEVKAYTQFICALCDMAKKQKRVLAKEKPIDNEKYAFRCFLLRLGMIGDEYAATRKVLLKNMAGNGSWRNGETKHPPHESAKKESKPAQPAQTKQDTAILKEENEPTKRGFSFLGWSISRKNR